MNTEWEPGYTYLWTMESLSQWGNGRPFVTSCQVGYPRDQEFPVPSTSGVGPGVEVEEGWVGSTVSLPPTRRAGCVGHGMDRNDGSGYYTSDVDVTLPVFGARTPPVRSRFSVSYGLRWEYRGPRRDRVRPRTGTWRGRVAGSFESSTGERAVGECGGGLR